MLSIVTLIAAICGPGGNEGSRTEERRLRKENRLRVGQRDHHTLPEDTAAARLRPQRSAVEESNAARQDRSPSQMR